jgi:aspartyl-tRNA synthetase
MASGSIRINRADLQTRVLDVIGVSPDDAEERFGFLLRALRFGAPPHGGIAPGIDRIAMQLGDTDNLREVVAFPKLGGGADPLTGAPAPLPPDQLAELGLAVLRPPPGKPAAG